MKNTRNGVRIRRDRKDMLRLGRRECAGRQTGVCCRFELLLTGSCLLVLAVILAGCVLPGHFSEWQWRDYNPEWKYLPGQPDR